MQLKCRINGIEYNVNLVQGSVFQEEYNEQLDSATIKISGVHEIKDLKPYDDVFLYDHRFNGYPDNSEGVNLFYKHLLVDQYSEVLKNIKDKLYEYTIDLFSETKKLEAIQLPNISITQPLLQGQKVSVWNKINQFVEIYSPQYKVVAHPQYKGYLGADISTTIISGESAGSSSPNEPLSQYFWDNSLNLYNFYIEIMVAHFPALIENPPLDITIDFDKNNIEETTSVYLNILNSNMTKLMIYYRDGNVTTQGFTNPQGEQRIALADKKVISKIVMSTNDVLTKNAYLKFEGPTKRVKWEYKKKYSVDASLEPIFSKCYSPDFTLNSPSLKDVLTQLMLTKDMIPYVKDDVICGLDISKRKGPFNFDVGRVTNITSSMSSDNFVDNLRRNYTNALSQERSARRSEFLGFRNSDNALMTLENMRLETQFPIYKINKVYLCYYKKGLIRKNVTNATTNKDFVFLCKQDITPLVQLNSSRNLLSSDWNNFTQERPLNTKDLARYKMCTVGYDIGSKHITGWGTKYTYPSGWWDVTKTYLENIISVLDSVYKYGIYTYGYVTELAGNRLESDEYIDFSPNYEESIVNMFQSSVGIFKNPSLNMKSFFFEVDYNAFYNGAVVHSKDDGLDDITVNDNSSSSLTLLEKDGLFQKEKANRFGNKAVVINATYQDISELQELGSVYGDDIVIYHREYAITDKTIQATYYGTKDYVLKNYFVSVYAKHRTYNLMSYGESVNRAENKKLYLMLSKNHIYYDDTSNAIGFSDLDESKERLLLSAFRPSEKATTIDFIKYPYKIDCAFIKKTGIGSYYLSDVNAFVSGNSLCFNVKMYDNVSAGVYISTKEPKVTFNEVTKDFTGSVQNWHILVDNEETGYIEKLGIYVGSLDKQTLFSDEKGLTGELEAKQTFDNRLRFLPKVITPQGAKEESLFKNKIGGEYLLYKDNKETIDMTLQIEPITDDYHNIFFSHWLMKLSDLLSSYTKIEQDYTQTDASKVDRPITFTSMGVSDNSWGGQTPLVLIEMNEPDVLQMKDKTNIYFNYTQIDYANKDGYQIGELTRLRYGFREIKNFNVSGGVVEGVTLYLSGQVWVLEGDIHTGVGEEVWYNLLNNTMTFKKIDNLLGNPCPSGKIWFSNCKEATGVYQGQVELLPENKITFKNPNYNEPSRTKWKFGRVNPIIYGQPMNTSNTETLTRGLATEFSQKPYYKNMYIRLVEQPMKKELVYNEYNKYQIENEPNTLLMKDLSVSSVIGINANENGSFKIRIDLTEVKNKPVKYQCLQYWFYEKDRNIMNFVFGVNITEQDLTKGYIDINISLLSKRDLRIYDAQHNVVGEMYDYNNDTQQIAYGSGLYYVKKNRV